MKQLLLYRHAKSSWDSNSQSDQGRPLSGRGHRDAAMMAAEIAKYPIDRVLCSPALRTLETLAALVPSLQGELVIAVVKSLYGSLTDDYRSILPDKGEEAGCLLVIGHNPAIQATALALIGSGDDATITRLAGKYPTGTLAVIDFDVDAWTELGPRSGKLTAFVRPRDLAEPD